MEASLRSAIAAAVASTHGQTRLASPGDGPALVLTPLGAQAAVSPGSVVSSAHTPLSSVRSAATSRTPIMRHAQHAKDDTPSTVAPEKAYKAPELTESRFYATWRVSFTSFLASYGLTEIVLHGPRFIVLPTAVEQLTAEERQGPAGYELQPGLESAAAADSRLGKRAEYEYDKCMFVAQALLHGAEGVTRSQRGDQRALSQRARNVAPPGAGTLPTDRCSAR